MRKSILILVTLMLLISILLGACNSGPATITSSIPPPTPTLASKTYINAGHKFSTEYPADWEFTENVTQDQGSQGILVMFMGNLSTQDSSIVIEADKWPATSTLQQYAAAVEDQILKKNLQDYVKLKEASAEIDGMPAIIRIFTATFKGVPRKYGQMYFKRGNFAYAVSYSTSVDSFDTFYNCFELVTGTFKFN